VTVGQREAESDSLALRVRYHDAAVHSKRMPGNALARSVFEALEQARVEARGARRGVRPRARPLVATGRHPSGPTPMRS